MCRARLGFCGICLSAVAVAMTGAVPLAADEGKDPCGWKLGMQAYSFNRFTFFEAVDKTKSLGLHYIEVYPGQKISKDQPALLNHDAPAEALEAVKGKLKEADIKVMCYGVVGLGKDEAANRKVFEFARKMGIETIVSEPEPDCFDLLDKLMEEYGINVAIHNHPKPSRYWNPDTVLAAVKGHSKRIGSCADTGHWMRSGVDPLEAIKKLEGRIISFHFKDLNEASRNGHDVPWGTGKANVEALLKELKRQNFKGVFSIEYEHNWLESVPEIAKCVEYFNKVATELAKSGS